jgi:predicted RNase H-like HicB family nuclease
MVSMTAQIRFEHTDAGNFCAPAPAGPSEAELVLRGETLAEARKMADGIAGVLALLRDLDGLIPQEPDIVRLDEIAALFADIGDFAAYGSRTVARAAEAMRLWRQLEQA